MSQLKKLATAGGTFAVALGIGFVMQNGDALAARMSGSQTAAGLPAKTGNDPVAPMSVATRGTSAIPLAAAAAVVSPPLAVYAASVSHLAGLAGGLASLEGAMPVAVSAAPPVFMPDLPEATIELAAMETDDLMLAVPLLSEDATSDCTIAFTATPGPAATADLVLTAACAPGAMTTIHHQGMMFSQPLSADGTASFTVPALASSSVFIAEMAGGDGAVAVVEVPDFALYDRVVLQWEGDAGLQLHALEFGAGYSENGHLWNASLGSVDQALVGSGGFMTYLGVPDRLNAMIYSYPTQMSARAGRIDLTVEAEVTAANCGREIAAQSMQFRPDAGTSALDLVMTLPGCDAIGEFLVLNNMLQDLTLTVR